MHPLRTTTAFMFASLISSYAPATADPSPRPITHAELGPAIARAEELVARARAIVHNVPRSQQITDRTFYSENDAFKTAMLGTSMQ